MGVIQEFFNNREIAIGIWVIIGLAVILPTKPARQFIKTAIPILFCKKFVIFYIVFLSFLGLVLFALNWAGLWDLTLLKDTVFWVLFVELPLFAKAIEKADGGRFFSNLIRENVAIVVAIEFFVGFWTFSLITEIILIPLTVLISVLQVLAGQDKEHRSAKRFFDGLLVLWGIILLINAIYSLIHAPNQFLSFDTLKSLLLPLVLLVFNLPVVYGLALYNTYEQIFIRIKGSKSEQKKMKWQVIRFSGINLSKVSAIRKSLPNTIIDPIQQTMSVALNQLVSLFASLLLALTKIFFKKYLTILHSIIVQYARAKRSALMVMTQTRMEWFKNATYAARNVVP